MNYLAVVSSHGGLCSKTFTANCAMKWAILQPFQLRLVVPQVLLQIRQLDKSPAAVNHVAFVRTLSCKMKEWLRDLRTNLSELQGKVWVVIYE